MSMRGIRAVAAVELRFQYREPETSCCLGKWSDSRYTDSNSGVLFSASTSVLWYTISPVPVITVQDLAILQ